MVTDRIPELTSMIRKCSEADFEEIYTIINDAAIAYQGVIPDELWKEPFVSRSYLASEIEAGVTFTYASRSESYWLDYALGN